MEGIFDRKSGSLQLKSQPQAKFVEDAISESIGCYDICTFGYFLNKKNVYEEYPDAGESLSALIKTLVDKGVDISKVLKGCYIVIIFNKDNNQLLIYNDLLSKYSLFYCCHETKLYFADNFYKLVTLVKKENVSLTLDMLAFKMLKSHNVLYDSITFVNEIKFLKPFQYISFEDELKVKCLSIPKVDNNILLSDTIEEVERLYNKAVEQQNSYNIAHGFKTCSTLSGGMDSRTAFLYCEKLGFQNHFCYCYAESGSKDNTIASDIANDYECPFFFSPIDNGFFIKNRDRLCDILGGQMWYAGSTGTYQSLSVYDTGKLGIINAGIGGGEIFGDDCVGDAKQDVAFTSFIAKMGLSEKEQERFEKIKENYRSYDEFVSVNDLRRCVASKNVAKSFGCDYGSPFLDEEFFSLMLTIPFDYKNHRRLYVEWQKAYNPAQFNYPTTYWRGASVGSTVSYQLRRIYQYFVRNILKKKTKYDMNPFEFWYNTNSSIRDYIADTYDKDMVELKEKMINNTVLDWINKSWQNSNVITKLSLLSITYTLNKILE